MDTDRSEPHTSPVGHQCVLDTLAAVCTQDSIVHDVIPRLIEDVQHICEGNSNDQKTSRLKFLVTVSQNLAIIFFFKAWFLSAKSSAITIDFCCEPYS